MQVNPAMLKDGENESDWIKRLGVGCKGKQAQPDHQADAVKEVVFIKPRMLAVRKMS